MTKAEWITEIIGWAVLALIAAALVAALIKGRQGGSLDDMDAATIRRAVNG